jgi:hypothetical protein
VQGPIARSSIVAALTAFVVGLTAGVVITLNTGRANGADPLITASVGTTPSGQPLPRSFVGVSLEFNWLHFYTGRNPKRIDPVLITLLRNLAPGQTPSVRIGGESTDSTWWPIAHQKTPQGVSYSLSNKWLSIVKGMASALGARLIVGVNFAADRPDIAAAEARAFLNGIGRRYIQALEIGNEPDNYGIFPWYRTEQGRGHWVWSRPNTYSLTDFISEFSRFRAALPAAGIAGPAFAELSWLGGLDQFFSAEPKLTVATVHRYPLHGCFTNQSDPTYPSTENLLADPASSGLAQAIAPAVSVAHAHHVPFRLDEMNSAAVAACLGKRGVSGTFASALWVLDTLFNLADVGVDGVNVHTLPSAAYELFSFRYHKRHWEAFVHPEYYGLLLFAQAFPAGAQLLPVSVSATGPLKVWATRSSSGTTRIVLINKDPSNDYQVKLQVPGALKAATLERLQARSVSSTNGVTLGGQTFGDEARTGTLGRPRTETVVPAAGSYLVTVPAASAALLTQ